jgi:hypothetical protein
MQFFFHARNVGVVYVAAIEPFEEDWEVLSVSGIGWSGREKHEKSKEAQIKGEKR